MRATDGRAPGERHVVRLRMPAETIVVDDLIRGRVEFPAEALDDFVLVRSDGHPLYHFCACVDDTDMAISHVIRGDDHLANTPKHVALFRALGAPIPKFAHLGMILGTDRKKLSKRHGAAAVEEWRDEGILPEALFNFLALLGWAPGDDREILTREEMEREFSLDRVGASPSVFDPEKLLWMNQQYIAKMPARELLARSLPYASAGAPAEEIALRAIELHRPRVRTTIEMGRALSAYAADPAGYDPDGLKKHVKPETVAPPFGARRAPRGASGMDCRVHGSRAAGDGRGRGGVGRQAHPPCTPGAHRRDGGRSALRRRGASGEGNEPAPPAEVPRGRPAASCAGAYASGLTL